jgi:uncharacterized protein YdaU (DUF1376 family)
MSKWYKRDTTAALDGMRCLTLEERGAYNTILDLIYDREGDLPDDDRFIAGWLGCHTAVWRRIKVHLVALRKISVVDGVITNHRAEKELSTRRVLVESSASSGRLGAKKRWRNKETQIGYPIATQTQIKKESKTPPQERRDNFEDTKKVTPLRPVATSYSEWDFVSTDGSIHFAAAELESMKEDYPSIKDVRAMVRQGARWADAEGIEPNRRKAAVLAWLAKKNLAAEVVRARESREVAREVVRDQRQQNGVSRHRGQAVLP